MELHISPFFFSFTVWLCWPEKPIALRLCVCVLGPEENEDYTKYNDRVCSQHVNLLNNITHLLTPPYLGDRVAGRSSSSSWSLAVQTKLKVVGLSWSMERSPQFRSNESVSDYKQQFLKSPAGSRTYYLIQDILPQSVSGSKLWVTTEAAVALDTRR